MIPEMKEVGFAEMMQVLDSWQTARRKEDFEEQLGIDTLLLMFELDPKIQVVFGFPPDKKITGLQRMGLLINGIQIIQVFDDIFSALGPDMDEVLMPILEDLGEEHLMLRLSSEHFQFLSQALMQLLPEKLDNWTPDLESSWRKVMCVVTSQLSKCVTNRGPTSLQKTMSAHTSSNVKSLSVTSSNCRMEGRIINTV